MRPNIVEKGLINTPDAFSKLGEGFKRLFVNSEFDSQLASSALKSASPKPVIIATTGYTGHRKGEKAENLFGKCFRDVSLNSKAIERGAIQKHRSTITLV